MNFLVALWAALSGGWEVPTNTTPTCAALPRQVLNFQGLVLQSPFRVVFSPFSPSYNCVSILYTMPTPGSSGYDIGSTYLNKTTVVGNYQLTLGTNQTYDTAQFCTSGVSSPHLFLKMSVTQDKGFCIFHCSSDGSAMADIKCVSRGGGLDAAAFKAVLATVSGVPGAPSASATLADCAKPQYCDYFD